MWGLSSRTVTCTLVRSYRTFPPLPAYTGGFRFYDTFPEVTLAGRYPAHCPVEPGLSSSTSEVPAIIFRTHEYLVVLCNN